MYPGSMYSGIQDPCIEDISVCCILCVLWVALSVCCILCVTNEKKENSQINITVSKIMEPSHDLHTLITEFRSRLSSSPLWLIR